MRSVKYTKSFPIARPVDDLFPLFSPEGEKRWVPGWDYINVTGSTELREDAIFLTAAHDHASTEAIWLVKRYEPGSHRVQFYKVEPGDKVGIITVQCRPLAPSATDVEVTYEYIALTERGEVFVQNYTAREYAAFIGEWQVLLERYFALKPQE